MDVPDRIAQALLGVLTIEAAEKLEEQIRHGKMLVSYNSNLPFGAKPGDSIYADFYRPRFVWVPIAGLQK